jgi:predicted esterase
MLKTYSVIFCLFLIGTNNVYAQDKTAKTAEGQIIILNKDGTWHVKNNIEIHDNKAVTDDGELVLLGRNGKWFSTNAITTSLSQQKESNQNIEEDYISANDLFKIHYSGTMATGIGCVSVPKITKNKLTEPRPLMLLFDPHGNAGSIVARWQHAADRFGWIIASTPAIMNGTPDEQDMLHLLALLDAVAAKWSIDRHAVILGGFSGGACIAYDIALKRPDLFRGAIVECGHMGPFRKFRGQIHPGLLFFLATRTDDYNAPAMHTLAKTFEDRGETVKLIELPGGHEPLIGTDTDDALGWINSMIR